MYVRNATNKKYGKLPDGFNYHHPEPYHVDNFEVLTKEEHLKKRGWWRIENGKQHTGN